MRDRRFVAAHRGGPLDITNHRTLAAWAADCAEHVLHLFSACSSDDRPRHAIETARAWSRGEVPTGVAQKAAVAAHAAAREMTNKAAIAAARAAGHAAATAHMADHSLGSVLYGLRAAEAAGESAEAEHAWQLAQISDDLRELAVSGFAALMARGRSRPRE